MTGDKFVAGPGRVGHLAAPVFDATKFADITGGLTLESGAVLPELTVAYRTWGTLSAACDNAVVICHALTGSADADDWWNGLMGPGRAVDPGSDFIVCANLPGGCYGTTGPSSINPATGRMYGPDFPALTIRDMVTSQMALVSQLGVKKVRLVIGGSLGGMLALEWAVMGRKFVDAVVSIAACGRHSAWCIGLSEAQRSAIQADPAWLGGRYDRALPPRAGLGAARMMAMCMYRSAPSFNAKFGRMLQNETPTFAVESYLRYQGDKLVDRFDANTYMVLTRAMDSHDLARGRGEYVDVLAGINQPTLVVSYDSDVLYPQADQLELAELIANATLANMHSIHGHDAFLIEIDELVAVIRDFRAAIKDN